jgi:outer membrane biogenesis lipoprotein LolB
MRWVVSAGARVIGLDDQPALVRLAGSVKAAAQRALLLAPFIALGACASLPLATTAPSQQAYSGRFSLTIDETQMPSSRTSPTATSGRFELVTGAGMTRIDLLSPLGTTMARFELAPEGASLSLTEDGAVRVERDSDPARLSARVLGWTLPLQDLVAWIRAEPDPGSPVQALSGDAPGNRHFQQDGWEVLAQTGTAPLKLRVSHPATAESPALSLRVVLDPAS